MRTTTKIGALLAATAFIGGGAVAAGAADKPGASEAECMQLKRDVNAAFEAGASKREIATRFDDRLKGCQRVWGPPKEPGRGEGCAESKPGAPGDKAEAVGEAKAREL